MQKQHRIRSVVLAGLIGLGMALPSSTGAIREPQIDFAEALTVIPVTVIQLDTLG